MEELKFTGTPGPNAQLIAAAPELLEALQTIIGFNRQQALDQYGDAEKAESWACVKTARHAINKALGINH
jgi:hypothetical protein